MTPAKFEVLQSSCSLKTLLVRHKKSEEVHANSTGKWFAISHNNATPMVGTETPYLAWQYMMCLNRSGSW